MPALGTAWIDPQLLLVARVTNSTQECTVSTPIERFDASQATAELAALEPSYVQGAWLMIPVRVAITRTGYYRLEANLYAQQDQRPLLHLSAEEEYGPGTQTLFLRAHISALKAMGDEGDYTLSDILLEQMPSAPDFETLTGLTSINSTAVNGYPFADYRDEPYQDEDAQARLEFLQSVANK